MTTLTLETRSQDDPNNFGGIALTPPIGIGFAVEEDWNTNLPYTVDTEEIYEHIEHNRGDQRITREQCLEAIRLIQEAATADRGERETAAERARIYGTSEAAR